ncbi:GntR family transcriptional repressor for pyruvate dehydrogenase complex [Kribbella sp. VKM Ac-2527]|uniref:GntR family transcriptional repressor for pyruvate dehydrogenase complex n=1 Tax=Kribbella caucasensis TaxID=2512215 RepID=A0A4R6KFM4_9ACTN|nr:FCD domain-containing protein [Kribbella sp. VKM Ac-2527]TDO48630.1 GntR family transcriptional repressor for pyruvate dehydrogenase complex [Kribbella sp. VKM Ac-2527]
MKNYELVLSWVEADLAAGRLRLGGRLPGERVLAEQLGISRPSVREAVRVLEALGVVRTATGSGPEAGAVIVAEPASPLTALLRLHLATNHLPMGDIVQTRVLLESWAARQAAELFAVEGAADRKQGAGGASGVGAGSGLGGVGLLGVAEGLLGRMEDPGLSPEEFHLLDAEFHVALSGVAGNVLIAAVMASLRSAIHGYVMAAVPNLSDWDATVVGLRAEHQAILAAVRAGEADRAARLVTDHIQGFYRAARLASPD